MRFLVMILIFLNCTIVSAQWSADFNLSNTSGGSLLPMNGGRCIMVDGNRVHVVYMDGSIGNNEIYYKLSSDGGQTWNSPVNLSNSLVSSSFPSVYFSGSQVWVLWTEAIGSGSNIFYSNSQDYGSTWSTPAGMSPVPSSGGNNITFCVAGSYLYAMWMGATNATSLATLFGSSWSSSTHFTGNLLGNPAIATNGSNVIITATTSFGSGSTSNVVYRRSIDYGATYSTQANFPGQSNKCLTPDLAIEGSHVHLTYIDNNSGNNQVYYQHSGDLGLTWDTPVPISSGTATCGFPSISSDGSAVVITWEKDVSGNYEIYSANSSTNGLTWNIESRLTNASGGSERSCVDISSNGTTHVIWIDQRDLNYEVYYKKAVSLPPSSGIGLEENVSLEFTSTNPISSEQAIEIVGKLTGKEMITLVAASGKKIACSSHLTTKGCEVTPGQKLEPGYYFLQIDSTVLTLIVI